MKTLPGTEEMARKEEKVAEELDDWFAWEELLWKQRERVGLLKCGEQNAVFFRAKAERRNERKFIDTLIKGDEKETRDFKEINEEFVKYFNKIFLPSHAEGSEVDWNRVMRAIQPRIPDAMNCKLIESYTYRG